MPSTLLQPRKALNKAYLKVKPSRQDIERFKTQLKYSFDLVIHTGKDAKADVGEMYRTDYHYYKN